MKNILIVFVIVLAGCRAASATGLNQSSNPVRTDTRALPINNQPNHCPPDMVHVEGDFCPEVVQNCLEQRPGDMRCFRFAPSICTSSRRVHMSFCADRYEWPNHRGERPQAMATYMQAQRECRSVGKRMCEANEWTFACEGPEMLPYPYGLNRDNQACNIDNPATISPNRRLLGSANNAVAMAEANRVYRAEPSGTRDRCVSWAGVHDLTGNLDEWNHNPRGHSDRAPYYSNLKGGDWRFVRTRCRPSTTAHSPSFRYYNIGWRCCQDAN